MKNDTLITVFIFVIVFGLSAQAHSFEFIQSSCPDSSDLTKGIVYTDPARVGNLYIRYRKLKGPYIGKSYINGIISDRVVVSYAGLFTYKSWDKRGMVRQYEESQSDMTELLKFEEGTQHLVKSIRYNPQYPDRKWKTISIYKINKAQDVVLGECRYSTVLIDLIATDTYPDGKAKERTDKILYIPELMLRVAERKNRYGAVSAVRARSGSDAEMWPFIPDASNVLVDQVRN